MGEGVKKQLVEIIVFTAIFIALLMCNLPAMTWINTDSDGAHYILSAKYMNVAHNTSAPLYLLIGRLFLFIPYGTDAWRMGLISVLATTGCAVLIYLVIRHHLFGNKNDKWYALAGSIIYGGSALVITQSTIIETYALSTMLSVGAYYFCLKRKWMWSSVFLGMTLAIHPLFFAMTWIVLIIAFKTLRNKKYWLVTASFLLIYLYIPITRIIADTPAMWGNASWLGFFKTNLGTMWMLAGGLSLYDIPKRVLDTIAILGVSLGLGLIVMVWGLITDRTWRSPLLWLIGIPIVYFIINLSAETYVYMLPSIAFGAIIIGISLRQMKMRYVVPVVGLAVTLLIFNIYYLDIGRTLDPNLSAQKYYDEELPKIKDGDIYMGGGWTWAIVWLYNREEGRNITSICTDVLPSQEYLGMLEDDGIKFVRTDSESFVDKQWEVAKSIALLNDNVWISKETDAARLEYEIVPAKDNMYLIDRWLGYNKQPEIAWKPSNPYAFITGALEVSEWKFILMSNKNARTAMVFAVYGLGFYWFLAKLFKRKKEDDTPTEKEERTTTT